MSNINHPGIGRLVRICERWGGSLRVLPHAEYDKPGGINDLAVQRRDGYSDAPFTVGHCIHWGRKEIVADDHHVKIGALGFQLYLDESGVMHLMDGPSHDERGRGRQHAILASAVCGADGGAW